MNRRIYRLPARDAKPAPISVPIITKTTFKILIKKAPKNFMGLAL